MTPERPHGELVVLATLAALRLALHVATAHGYGIFRDELYYLACADPLDWGYVDRPGPRPARREGRLGRGGPGLSSAQAARPCWGLVPPHRHNPGANVSNSRR